MLRKLFRLFPTPIPRPTPVPVPAHFTVTPPKLYLRLFHGRPAPDTELSDWGSDGPYIGPIQINWTYGNIKIHDEECYDFEELRQAEDLILFDGVYYGDFDILQMTERDVFDISRHGHTFITAGQFHNTIRAEKDKLKASTDNQ